ncbi:MAG TPA: Type 1 glutamine amidotransferase-like domain-containing protein [Anaerolineales bacterium]
MNGLIALLGSGEYLQVMDPVDRFLLDSLKLDGRGARVVCLPTAAGREGEGSVSRWSRMGVEHFTRLGAEPTALRIIDRETADDTKFEPLLEAADLIYFSGGDPVYLYQTLQGSRAWAAAKRAWERGAAYAGCSAGAMVLAQNIPNLRMAGVNSVGGFGLFPAAYVFPHYDAMPVIFKPLVAALRRGLKEMQFIAGIEENTALVGRLGGEWRAMGVGRVHIIRSRSESSHVSGASVPVAVEGTSGA